MSRITEIETFDLEPGLVVRISENIFAKVLYVYQNWLIPEEKMVNFSNKRYDGSYEDTKLWEVV